MICPLEFLSSSQVKVKHSETVTTCFLHAHGTVPSSHTWTPGTQHHVPTPLIFSISVSAGSTAVHPNKPETQAATHRPLSLCLPALQSSVCLKYFSAALSLLGCPLGRAARTYSRPHHESLGYTNSFLTSCPSGWRPSHQCSILEPGDLAFLKNASPYF